MKKTIFGRLFGASKQKPEDTSMRESVERGRLAGNEPGWSELSPELQKSISFSEAEKISFFEARRKLVYLPTTGPDGGWYQRIANDASRVTGLQCTRQYAQLVLWPDNPGSIFAGRSPLHKAVWVALEALVTQGLKNPQVAGYSKILDALVSGKSAWVRNMRTSRLSLIESKIRKLGLVVTAHICREKVPYDFLFVPAKPMPPGKGTMVTEDTTSSILDKLRASSSEIELFGADSPLVDHIIPNLVKKTRTGVRRYKVALA